MLHTRLADSAPPVASRWHQESGSALVIVLGFLVLTTVLVLAFFTSVTTESVSAKSYSTEVSTKQLAESAMQCVMGAIRQATSQGANIAWASQPGMIRTYGDAGNIASSNPLAYYKLYSSDNMVVTNGLSGYDFSTDYDATWSNKPSMWIDLNSPVTASGSTNFPIINGNGIKSLTKNAAGTTVPAYYGYDTNGNGYPDIDGFFIDPSKVSYDPSKSVSSSNNPVPMPVKWIYVLRDGTLTTPDSATTNTATWSGAGSTVPTASNPIVARMAFWTDDETCKLNINTASEGSYWDTLSFGTQADLNLARSGPAQREYNRYPGHPAGVSLSPVLAAALGLPEPTRFSLQPAMNNVCPDNGAPTFVPSFQFASGATNYFQQIFSMTPRFIWGGSQMGTVATAGSIDGTGSSGIAKTSLSQNRLYASIDEMLFSPGTSGATSRPFNPTNASAGLSPSSVEMMRFFLTTSSRAPDVNPFGRPKISLWPIDDETKVNPINDYFPNTPDQRSPLDKFIGFCSTVNGKRYYFTRNNPFDPIGDFTTRNSQLYDSLVTQLSTLIPGYGASLSSRYPGLQTPQIVTEIYDYIRSAINLNNGTAPAAAAYTTAPYLYSFCKPFEYKNLSDPYGYTMCRLELGEVVPFTHPVNGTKGVGRFPTIQQACIMFMAVAANQPPVQTDAAGTPISASLNPLHDFPSTLPTSVTTAANANGTAIYTYSGGFPYPTLYTTNSGASWITAATNSVAARPTSATNGPSPAPATSYAAYSAQTHSGLRYLTEQDPVTGTFTMPNPRYQGPALTPGQTQIQAVLFFNMADPAAGDPALASHYKLRVTGGATFAAGGTSLNIANGIKEIRSDAGTSSEISSSGISGFGQQILGRTSGANPTNQFVFNSVPVIISNDTSAGSTTFPFTGGTIQVDVLNPSNNAVVQTATINFPDGNFPTPMLPNIDEFPSWYNTYVAIATNVPNPVQLTPSSMLTLDTTSSWSTAPNTGVSTNVFNLGCARFYAAGSGHRLMFGLKRAPMPANPAATAGSDLRWKLTCDTIRAVEVAYGDTRLTACLTNIPSSFFVPNRYYSDPEMPDAHSLIAGGTYGNIFVASPTVGSLVDFYLDDPSKPLVRYGTSETGSPNAAWSYPTAAENKFRTLYTGGYYYAGYQGAGVPSSATFGLSSTAYNAIPGWGSLTDFPTLWKSSGDFDNDMINGTDGPLINKPEEGMEETTNSAVNPYFPDTANGVRYYLSGSSIYSPNRQVASPVVLGSLPAGIDPAAPSPSQAYRTLLFCPNPNAQAHPSLAKNPPDSVLLDFFHMPVVEPYAISEPLSTAGKVNMNYQIAPFSYIKRETSIRGAMRGLKITAVPDRWIQYYRDKTKIGNSTRIGADNTTLDVSTSGYDTFRFPICEDDTLKEFENRFSQNDLFRNPSEICSLWLYPAVQPNATTTTSLAPQQSLLTPASDEATTHKAIKSWWYDSPGGARKSLTGDNLRERPYNALYPRLTTKSNTFTVHVRVQKLAKIKSDAAQNTFNETTDKIIGEFRGSFTVERYIDPNDSSIPDFAASPTGSLDPYYRFRVLGTKQFGQ